jgi:hypothetical protein
MSTAAPLTLGPDAAEEVLRACLRECGAVHFRVTGSCMAPHLPAGRLVVVSAREQPRWGDVVLVRQENGLRLHRLVARPLFSARGPWRTQGDRLPAPDPPLQAHDVLGTVVDPPSRSRWRALRAWAAAAWRRLGAAARA